MLTNPPFMSAAPRPTMRPCSRRGWNSLRALRRNDVVVPVEVDGPRAFHRQRPAGCTGPRGFQSAGSESDRWRSPSRSMRHAQRPRAHAQPAPRRFSVFIATRSISSAAISSARSSIQAKEFIGLRHCVRCSFEGPHPALRRHLLPHERLTRGGSVRTVKGRPGCG